MCAVSMITNPGNWPNGTPHLQPWTRDTFDEFQEIIKMLKKLDAKMGQPNCEDPAKIAWMKEVEKRLNTPEDDVGGEG